MEDVKSDQSAPPRDLRSLRALIIDRQERLPKRPLLAGQFALAHPQDMAFGTIAEVAQSASVQPSTLVRFAQALGSVGFSDLQAVFRCEAGVGGEGPKITNSNAAIKVRAVSPTTANRANRSRTGVSCQLDRFSGGS